MKGFSGPFWTRAETFGRYTPRNSHASRHPPKGLDVTPPGLVTPSVNLAPSRLRPWRALRASVLAVGATVLTLGATPGDPTVPLWGHWSVGMLAAFAAAATGGILAYRAYTRRTDLSIARGHHDHHWSHRTDAVSTALAHALISGLLVALVFIALNNLTGGAHVTALQATVAAGISIAVVSLIATVAASRNETIHAVGTLMSLTVLGSLTSIMTTPDPNWWQLHFSQLGTFHVFSGYMFNGTLIATGTLIVAFSFRVRRVLLTARRQERLRSVRAPRVFAILVASVGFHMAMVGFIPVNQQQFLHDRAATGMTLSFAALLILTPWLMRGLPARLTRATGAIAIILVAGATVFIFGIINLAAFEILAFGLMFSWIGVFATCVETRHTPVVGPVVAVTPPASVPAPAPVSRRDVATGRPRRPVVVVSRRVRRGAPDGSAARALPPDTRRAAVSSLRPSRVSSVRRPARVAPVRGGLGQTKRLHPAGRRAVL